jgi:hypothetical protein
MDAREKTKALKAEVRSKVAGYLAAALGLVAGLAWNDAIKSLIEYFFPLSDPNSLALKFGYALLITLFVTVVTLYIAKYIDPPKDDK